jgi:glyoxylase-like metal-dependent hydrolase (beta-lactamase superfamily II)
MREIIPNIYCIDTEAFGQKKIIASYLIKGKNRTALIDPGFPSSAGILKDKLRKNNIDPSSIDYILLTHFHLDHSGGAGAFIRYNPDAKVLIHRRAAFYVKNFGKIVGGARMVFRHELIRRFGDAFAVPAENIGSFSDGDLIDLGGGIRLRVIHTPGHCADEVTFYEEASGSVFTGDVACLQYPAFNQVAIPAGSPPLFDMAEELNSLGILRSLKVEKIFIPHFGEIEGSWKDFLDQNREAINNMKEFITGMFRENIEFPQMVEKMRANVIRDSGRREEDIPDFLRDVYIREMLKTGLMGFLAYLLQYAPYPRSFSSEICGNDISEQNSTSIDQIARTKPAAA